MTVTRVKTRQKKKGFEGREMTVSMTTAVVWRSTRMIHKAPRLSASGRDTRSVKSKDKETLCVAPLWEPVAGQKWHNHAKSEWSRVFNASAMTSRWGNLFHFWEKLSDSSAVQWIDTLTDAMASTFHTESGDTWVFHCWHSGRSQSRRFVENVGRMAGDPPALIGRWGAVRVAAALPFISDDVDDQTDNLRIWRVLSSPATGGAASDRDEAAPIPAVRLIAISIPAGFRARPGVSQSNQRPPAAGGSRWWDGQPPPLAFWSNSDVWQQPESAECIQQIHLVSRRIGRQNWRMRGPLMTRWAAEIAIRPLRLGPRFRSNVGCQLQIPLKLHPMNELAGIAAHSG